MAATFFDAGTVNAELSSAKDKVNLAATPSFIFDIYDDGVAAQMTDAQPAPLIPSQQPQPQPQLRQLQQSPYSPTLSTPALPRGPCNYVDLSHGANTVQCGCRRFWSRSNSFLNTPAAPSFGALPAARDVNSSHAESSAGHAGWCMCSHHACFHDVGSNISSEQTSLNTSFFTTGIAHAQAPKHRLESSLLPQPPSRLSPNQSSGLHRAPLGPVQVPQEGQQEMDCDELALPEISFGFPSHAPAHLDTSFVAMLRDAARESRDITMATAEAVAPEDEVPTEDEEAVADVAVITPTLPPPPSVLPPGMGPPPDHLIPDTLSWGACGMPGHGETSTSLAGSINVSHSHPRPHLPQQAPPSIATTTSFTSQSRYMRPFAGRGLQTLTQVKPGPASTVSGPFLRASQEQNAAAASVRPLGLGTNATVTQPCMNNLRRHEDLSFCASTTSISASIYATQAHEDCVERYDQMDMRVTELESRLGEVERCQTNIDNDTTTVTAGSFASASASEASSSRIVNATCRTPKVAPTADPFMLKVVFLPFPLKGIWVEAGQFGPTEAVASAAAAQRSQRSASTGDTDGEDEWKQKTGRSAAPRLLPRACVPDRDIHCRLRSRGLVQAVSVHGPDAHSLHMAMVAAFSSLLRIMSSNNTSAVNVGRRRSSSTSLVQQFLGLQQPWVPLRKVHKDSRLRLLKCSEMLTPALWDVNFMKAGVIMKAAGLHRLFVTQPGAYLQNRNAYTHGWSWQRLRELPQAHAELENGARDADESFWAWNSRLDEPPEASASDFTSFASPSPLLAVGNLQTLPSLGRENSSARRTQLVRDTYPLTSVAAATAERASSPAVPTHRSHLASIRTSASSDQFFTAAQSPMQQHLPQQALPRTVAGQALRTASISPRQSMSSPLASRPVAPLIRTTSMPPPQMANTMTRGATPGTASGRRIHSTGSDFVPAPAASTRPLSAGVNKNRRRRSTRSPNMGGIWLRNTPRPSRSRSGTPALSAPLTARMVAAEEQRLQEHAVHNQNQTAPQRVRGTTPFAYATPFSTGTGHIPSISASSKASGSSGLERQRQERRARQGHRKQQLQYRRNSRYGSRGPIAAVLIHTNDGPRNIDTGDMFMFGDGIEYFDGDDESDESDNFDFSMSQDEDDDDDDDDINDIEVYEDEQDMLGLGSRNDHLSSHARLDYESGRQLLPKDRPQQGIEFDGEFEREGDEGDGEDSNNFTGHYFGGQQYNSMQNRHDELDEEMSDDENMDPLPVSLHGNQNNEYGLQPLRQSPMQQQDGEEHHSDQSSQPSEYTSKRGPWQWRPAERKRTKDEDDFGFKIHEDGDASDL
ncbi:hypothetical protein SEPCBS119000_004146 [Sporothrix epigloea]|uniref:Uncharacterized protein n=1 Tax=Sporothrix epigloea TaxID=1892477 RepID=A0ABP0DUB3_9PEZI